MHWCGPNRFITGLNPATNGFNCAGFVSGSNINYTTTLGNLFLDYGTNPTQRSGMHACPTGSMLVGAHLATNTFLCAEMPFCNDDNHCSSTAKRCEFQSIPCVSGDCLFTSTGICRAPSRITLLSDAGCGGSSDGWLTGRSGSAVNLSANDAFDNDDAESMRLTNIKAGAIIRVFDSPSGSQQDDFVNVLVKTATGPALCLPTFEFSQITPTLTTSYTSFGNDLDDAVSRIEVTSALIGNGSLCADINTNDNSLQTFQCHMGPNQRWAYLVDETIRGLNGACLEALQSDINTWPGVAAGSRSARVRVSACTGGANQKWSVTKGNEIRLFGHMCLDIRGGGTAPGTPLQIFPCHGGPNQRWLTAF